MPLIIDEGVSTKSFIISMVFTTIGLGSIVLFLSLFDGNTPTMTQMAGVAFTLSMLAVGFSAWVGLFDKKKEPPHRRFERERGFDPDEVDEAVKPAKPKKTPPKVDSVNEFVNNFLEKEKK